MADRKDEPDVVSLREARARLRPELEPDRGEIRSFLENFAGADSGDLQLVGIPSDGFPEGWPETSAGKPRRTIAHWVGDDLDEALVWAVRWNELGINLYWSPNQVEVGYPYKAPKDRIVAVRFVYADQDCLEGETEEQTLARLMAKTEASGLPPSTFAVWSGGGLNPAWVIEPYEIESVEQADEYERRTRGVADVLGADRCWNIDRVLRLPGTINWLNEAKRKRGRQPSMSRLVFLEPDRVYSIDDFPVADPVIAKSVRESKFSADAAKKVTLEELVELVADERVRHQIIHGKRPGQNGVDRSEQLWNACCAMARAGLDDAAIYGIITDPKWKISAHVLEQSDPDRAARRALERARAAATPEPTSAGAAQAVKRALARRAVVNESAPEEEEPESGGDDGGGGDEESSVEFLNQKHAWIETLGKAVYMDDDGKLSFMSASAVREGFNNRSATWTDENGDVNSIPLGTAWLKSKFRRTYKLIGLYPPPVTAPPRTLNLWRGLSVEPSEGDWSKTQSFIADVVAGGDDEIAEYIFRWCAFLVQYPGLPAEVALVLKGGRGVGKGTFASILRSFVDRHACHVSAPDQLTGRFNGSLESVFCFADEAFFAGDKKALGALNRLITEPTLRIERKGLEAYEVENRLHVLIAGNDDWVVPAGTDERRYMVVEVSASCAQNHDYFRMLREELDAGGREAMLYDLINFDLDGWHPRQVVGTAALREQQERSFSPEHEWLLELLREGELPRNSFGNREKQFASSKDLIAHASETVPILRGRGMRGFVKMLRSIGAQQGHSKDKKTRGWKFLSLAESRELWCQKFWRTTWDDGGEEKDW